MHDPAKWNKLLFSTVTRALDSIDLQTGYYEFGYCTASGNQAHHCYMLPHVYGTFPDHAHIRNVLCRLSTRAVYSVALSHPDPCLSPLEFSIVKTFGHARPFEETYFDMASAGDMPLNHANFQHYGKRKIQHHCRNEMLDSRHTRRYPVGPRSLIRPRMSSVRF